MALLLVLFFFNTYAAITDYGRPARLDCWDKVDMINRTKFTIFGDPEWIPFRCPAYCQYRGDGIATPAGKCMGEIMYLLSLSSPNPPNTMPVRPFFVDTMVSYEDTLLSPPPFFLPIHSFP